MTIGEQIRKLRRGQNMTQVQLAEKAGIAVNTLRQYEGEKCTPRQKQLELLANALNVAPTDITNVTASLTPVGTASESTNDILPIIAGQFYPTGEDKAIFVMAYEDGSLYVHPNFPMPEPGAVTWCLSEEDVADITAIVLGYSARTKKGRFSPEVGAGIKLMLDRMAQKSKRLFETDASKETNTIDK